MIKLNDDVLLEKLEEKVSRKVLITGDSLMMVEVYFKEGGIGQPHAHDNHEQVSYVVKGRFEVEVDGVKKILTSGDSFYANKKSTHGVKALEDSILLDTFTPIREDFL